VKVHECSDASCKINGLSPGLSHECTPDQLSPPVLKVAAVSKICMGCNSPAPCNSLAIGGFVLEYLVHNNKETRERRKTEVHTCVCLESVPKRCPCEKDA